MSDVREWVETVFSKHQAHINRSGGVPVPERQYAIAALKDAEQELLALLDSTEPEPVRCFECGAFTHEGGPNYCEVNEGLAAVCSRTCWERFAARYDEPEPDAINERWAICKDAILKFAHYVLVRGGLDASSLGDRMVLDATLASCVHGYDVRDEEDPTRVLVEALHAPEPETTTGRDEAIRQINGDFDEPETLTGVEPGSGATHVPGYRWTPSEPDARYVVVTEEDEAMLKALAKHFDLGADNYERTGPVARWVERFLSRVGPEPRVEPVAKMLVRDGESVHIRSPRHVSLTDGDYDLYPTPVDLRRENEELREGVAQCAGFDSWDEYQEYRKQMGIALHPEPVGRAPESEPTEAVRVDMEGDAVGEAVHTAFRRIGTHLTDEIWWKIKRLPDDEWSQVVGQIIHDLQAAQSRTPTEPTEAETSEKWRHMAVWFKGSHWYIANLADGEGGIGPFDSEADAKAALRGLRTPTEPREDEEGR